MNNHQNPLLDSLYLVLKRFPNGLREYDLLQELADESVMQAFKGEAQLVLFQKHFLLMNAAYQLRERVKDEGFTVEISPLNISLRPLSKNFVETLPDQNNDGSLSGYYLDWTNFDAADTDSVRAMLDDFWQRFYNIDARHAALKTLSLDARATAADIRKRYRELAAQHHPDRGGDAEQFRLYREAYEVLKLS